MNGNEYQLQNSEGEFCIPLRLNVHLEWKNGVLSLILKTNKQANKLYFYLPGFVKHSLICRQYKWYKHIHESGSWDFLNSLLFTKQIIVLFFLMLDTTFSILVVFAVCENNLQCPFLIPSSAPLINYQCCFCSTPPLPSGDEFVVQTHILVHITFLLFCFTCRLVCLLSVKRWSIVHKGSYLWFRVPL